MWPDTKARLDSICSSSTHMCWLSLWEKVAPLNVRASGEVGQQATIKINSAAGWKRMLAAACFVWPKREIVLSTICLCYTVVGTEVGGGFNTKGKGWDSWASPGAGGERLFSLTKDVRSQGSGKSCAEFKSASCREAHLWPVEEASFSSSVAWSSCRWDWGSSGDSASCNMEGGGGCGQGHRRRPAQNLQTIQTCDELESGVFFGDLFTLKVLLRKKIKQSISIQYQLSKGFSLVRWQQRYVWITQSQPLDWETDFLFF